MSYKLSFIIPVYNVEKYLAECIDSILSQGKSGYEIILVDDGSTDQSSRICDEFQYNYQNIIKVIHKPNGGLSSARTTGLSIAQGDYIAFLDSDDRISAGAIDKIMDWIKTASVDICFMQAVKFFEDGKRESLGDNVYQEGVRKKGKSEVISYLCSRPKYPGSACTKLFRRNFLYEGDISFPQDRRTNEDLGFTFDCLLTAETFDALDCPYYEYRQGRQGSITKSNTLKGFWDHALFVNESIEKVSLKQKDNEKYSKQLLAFVAYEFALMIYMFARLGKVDRIKAHQYLREHLDIMKYGKSKKVKMVYVASRVVGISLTSKLLNYYKAK